MVKYTLSHLCCYNVLYCLNNPSVIFLTQLNSISEYCRILNTILGQKTSSSFLDIDLILSRRIPNSGCILKCGSQITFIWINIDVKKKRKYRFIADHVFLE